MSSFVYGISFSIGGRRQNVQYVCTKAFIEKWWNSQDTYISQGGKDMSNEQQLSLFGDDNPNEVKEPSGRGVVQK